MLLFLEEQPNTLGLLDLLGYPSAFKIICEISVFWLTSKQLRVFWCCFGKKYDIVFWCEALINGVFGLG